MLVTGVQTCALPICFLKSHRLPNKRLDFVANNYGGEENNRRKLACSGIPRPANKRRNRRNQASKNHNQKPKSNQATHLAPPKPTLPGDSLPTPPCKSFSFSASLSTPASVLAPPPPSHGLLPLHLLQDLLLIRSSFATSQLQLLRTQVQRLEQKP